ncbi:MAG: alkaline phosphatase family protein [Actinomycetota bacterium]
MPRRVSRRHFIGTSAAAAAGVLLSSPRSGLRAQPGSGPNADSIDTQWPIKRVVYLMLENRSFDNIFGRFPGANGATVGVREGQEVPLIRCPEWLPGDMPHDTFSYYVQLNDGKQDGFAHGKYGPFYAYSQFEEQQIPNYYHWGKNYVLCDNFFQSAIGPSHPNHLFFIAGTSGGAIDNPENIRVRAYPDGRQVKSWGIDADGEAVYVFVRDERGNLTKHSTAFDVPTYGEELSRAKVDWAYYAAEPHQPGYIWSAYSAIPNVFLSDLWDQHIRPVDDLLADIQANELPSVTWITPRFQLSDHPPFSTCHAHDWVTDIVNSIMRSAMWDSVAIFITWDEWGGFYDHVPPPSPDPVGFGFRVPMLVVSPYARHGYIDDALGEFSSPLKFIADNWDLPYLTDRVRATHNFEHVFDFSQSLRRPDPQPKLRNCTSTAFEFPEDYDGWLEGIEPDPPKIA